ncbi:MAG: metallophosphoesterase [Clostridia bacterium]|nr:metallophosphoesterase [Clostridia bacterium]
MQEMPVPQIVERNRDVEHIVYASSRYGHHGFGKRNKDKLFSMLVSTDIHHCPSVIEAAVDYLNYHAPLDCGICLGDIIAADFREDGNWYTEHVLAAKKPFLTLLGNHDVGNSAEPPLAATSQMAFEKYMRPVAEKIGVEGLDRPYYVRLFEEYKIAVIALHAYDTPNNLDENGNYAVHRGMEMLSQEQIDWLIAALAGIPAGYHLAIAMHSFPYGHEAEPGAWTQAGKDLGSLSAWDKAYGETDLLTDIVHAWKTGSARRGEYIPRYSNLPTITVDCDFSARGNGNFIGYLVGHYHRDVIAHSKKYPSQKMIAFASAANDAWQNYDCDLPRAEGTKAEDLLTVCSIDTDKREIRLVRVGSNITMEMTERTYIVIPY